MMTRFCKRKLLIGLSLSLFLGCLFGGSHSREQSRLNSEKTKLQLILESIPDCQVELIEPESIFTECYQVMLKQLLDHQNPAAGSFQQRIIVSHVDFDKPVVMATEGYAIRKNMTRELTEMTGGNEIRVEHRFFGESIPSSTAWNYLHFRQAAADHHRIVELFKPHYPGKWLNTGMSKGGKVAMIHRWLYPDDVDVTVAYDSPLNFAQEDPRINAFFDEVGTEEQRQKLITFQRLVLTNKDEILPRFKWYAKGKEYTFSMDLEKGFEFIVLEYPFSFWQYTDGNTATVPGKGASPDELLEHLLNIVSASAYSDRALNSPAIYQTVTQFGYYGYVKKNVRDLLTGTKYSNSTYAPQDVDLTFDPKPMIQLNEWIQNHGDRMIFIYGSNDPWSANAVVLTGKTDALKMTLKGGNHFTFINSFPKDEREMILRILERWLELKLHR